MTTMEAANFLKVSEPQMRLMGLRGDVPSIKFGKLRRYRQEDLERFVRAHLVNAPSGLDGAGYPADNAPEEAASRS